MPIAHLQIPTQSSCDQSQDMTGKAGDLYPRQDEKPMVIGHKVQLALALCCTPTDVAIPGRTTPCDRTEQKTGQWSTAAVSNQIGHVITHGLREAQVMVTCQQPGKQRF